MSDISSSDLPDVHRPTARRRSFTFSLNTLLAIVVVALLCLASFFGGIAYGHGHEKSAAAGPATSAFGGGGFGSGTGGYGRRGGGYGNIGSVTAISSSSITIDSRSGSSETFSITSATTITDNGQTVPASSIAVGDLVIISTSSSSSTVASRILVNPSFGGGYGGQGSSTGSSTGSATAN